jgi:hypothetical protein
LGPLPTISRLYHLISTRKELGRVINCFLEGPAILRCKEAQEILSYFLTSSQAAVGVSGLMVAWTGHLFTLKCEIGGSRALELRETSVSPQKGSGALGPFLPEYLVLALVWLDSLVEN